MLCFKIVLKCCNKDLLYSENAEKEIITILGKYIPKMHADSNLTRRKKNLVFSENKHKLTLSKETSV